MFSFLTCNTIICDCFPYLCVTVDLPTILTNISTFISDVFVLVKLRVELMDYLDSIDCSLEDFQAMLYGKQFSIDPDILEVSIDL